MREYAEGDKVMARVNGEWRRAFYLGLTKPQEGWAAMHRVDDGVSASYVFCLDKDIQSIVPYPGSILGWGRKRSLEVETYANGMIKRFFSDEVRALFVAKGNEYGSVCIEGYDVRIFPEIVRSRVGDHWIESMAWQCGTESTENSWIAARYLISCCFDLVLSACPDGTEVADERAS